MSFFRISNVNIESWFNMHVNNILVVTLPLHLGYLANQRQMPYSSLLTSSLAKGAMSTLFYTCPLAVVLFASRKYCSAAFWLHPRRALFLDILFLYDPLQNTDFPQVGDRAWVVRLYGEIIPEL